MIKPLTLPEAQSDVEVGLRINEIIKVLNSITEKKCKHDIEFGCLTCYNETIKKQEWKEGDRFWFIDTTGTVYYSEWGGQDKQSEYKNFLGIWRTEKEAQSFLEKLKLSIKEIK